MVSVIENPYLESLVKICELLSGNFPYKIYLKVIGGESACLDEGVEEEQKIEKMKISSHRNVKKRD